MATTRRALAFLAGLAGTLSCSVGTLFDSPPTIVIAVTPTRVVDSASSSDAMRVASVVISTSTRDATAPWTARSVQNAPWLGIADSSGTAPDTLGLELDPTGLAAGVYRDTIAIDPSDPRLARVRVPVELHIVPSAPPPATQLAFTVNPPGVLLLNGSFSVEVTARDAQGRTAAAFSGLVSLTLQGPIAAGGLSGRTSVNAVNGIATFSDLKVTGVCTECALVASASGPSSATSSSFNVILGP